ncbi:MAG TPA: peptidyl-prolyl cis-trans isomerase [Vicinamibacterales bacterium]|nr:peptidyl-prolyl cis-trans isomerase [Vicinamibacterales bacterium]
MTMLDRMRLHRNWLKWSLALVCVAFVIAYIPDFVRGTDATATTGDTLAIVEGREIKADEFQRNYQSQLAAYRQAYGGNMSEQLLKQLGVDQQILQQMLDERAALVEADRLGITVSDAEVAKRIANIPAFQENGQFIGEQRYRLLLSAQRPPLTATEFEESIRRSLVADKLRSSLTQWMSVSDAELEKEYQRRNEKVKLAVVTVTADSQRSAVNVSDADVKSYFDAHTADFRIPEKRKVRYVLVDLDAVRAKIVVPQSDIERAYNENIEQYSTPEQIRASHILFKTEGKDDAAVRAKAEDVLKQARAGADFAALAKKYSEDEASAKNGGDLDFFGRGRMVPEFDAVAFTLEPGAISDLVKTQFGYHIIKVTDKKPGTSQELSTVSPQISDQIAAERAQTQAADIADRLTAQITKASDLDAAARSQGLQVQESGFFARDEPILALGGSPEVAMRAFELQEGQASGQIRTPRGYVFIAYAGKQDSYIPKFDEVKDHVRDVVVLDRAKQLSQKKAAELAEKLKGGDFEKAAKAAGAEAKTTEFITRDAPVPDLGQAPAVLDAAFAMTPGSVSGPIATDNGTAIVKLIEKEGVTPADFQANKESFREQVVNDRRNRFFSAYMQKAKQNMRIQVNRDVMQRVIG